MLCEEDEVMRQCLQCLACAVELYDKERRIYRCEECEEEYSEKDFNCLRKSNNAITHIDTSIIYDPLTEDYTIRRIRT